MSAHRPPHIYSDDTWYFITAATYQKAPLLASDQAKVLMRDTIQALLSEYQITLRAWVVLDDHYHLLLRMAGGALLPRFLNRLHGRTSRQINLWEAANGRTVWYSYWDTCIRDEAGYWTRFNYIHYNPVKHGYVAQPSAWAYSSYRYYRCTRGEAWLRDCLTRYPVRAADLDEGEDPGAA